MMRIAHSTHRWNYSAQTCRQCECAASSQAALEVCPNAKPRPKVAAAPTQESLNRALAVGADRGR